MIKAIDKSNSPLWVRILVWILVGGLMAASAVGIVAIIIMGISGWEEMGEEMRSPQPIVITPDDLDLPPDELERLLEQMAEAEQEAGAEQDSPPTPDAGEDNE